jgi:hypothetical protein
MDLTSSVLREKIRDHRNDVPTDSALAASAAIAKRLRDGMSAGGGRSWTRHEIIDFYAPTITDLFGPFGEAVVAGLGPRSMPAGRCRWCLVRLKARVRGVRVPKTSPALRELLGEKCPKCAKASVGEAAARVALVSSARAQWRRFDALVASGTVMARDARGRVTRLRTNDTFEAPVTRFVEQKCGCDKCFDAYTKRQA